MNKIAHWFYSFVIPTGAAHFAAERRDIGFPQVPLDSFVR
jgi:hypothetical protein